MTTLILFLLGLALFTCSGRVHISIALANLLRPRGIVRLRVSPRAVRRPGPLGTRPRAGPPHEDEVPVGGQSVAANANRVAHVGVRVCSTRIMTSMGQSPWDDIKIPGPQWDT